MLNNSNHFSVQGTSSNAVYRMKKVGLRPWGNSILCKMAFVRPILIFSIRNLYRATDR
jgi:hypothetical protein